MKKLSQLFEVYMVLVCGGKTAECVLNPWTDTESFLPLFAKRRILVLIKPIDSSPSGATSL